MTSEPQGIKDNKKKTTEKRKPPDQKGFQRWHLTQVEKAEAQVEQAEEKQAGVAEEKAS